MPKDTTPLPPPLIACGERDAPPALPVRPKVLHIDALGAYAHALLGIIEQLATQRADTADCLDGKRKEGVIR